MQLSRVSFSVEALSHAFAFFRKLFSRFPVRIWPLDVAEGPWILVYTDACKNTRRGGLGTVIFDRASGRKYVSSGICPPAIEDQFARGGHIINQLELLAILATLLTYRQLLRGKRVYWHVDNCAALSACVHGYANKLDMAMMANSVQLALCALGARAYFEWVPTEANIADTPSRVSRVEDMDAKEQYAWTTLGLPGQNAWDVMILPLPHTLHSYDSFNHLLQHEDTISYIPPQ